jgi:hypothetical protein
MRVTEEERDLVERFVTFVNLDIKSTAQVEELFGEAATVAGLMRLAPHEADAYRSDQAALRTIVGPLADAFGSPRRLARLAARLRPQVRAGLGDKPCPTWFALDDAGRLRTRFTPNGVALCCWIAVALLVDPDRGLLGRLGRCGACGRYVVSFSGRPRRHCSPAHLERFRRQTGARRQARYRARKKKSKQEKKRRETR